jgi:hypothetical protein
MRTITKNTMRSAMIAAGFSFCYGLWGATRLGYSEVFVTYATHTQFAIIVCLLGILLLVHLRILWASTFFGLAANINLFMAVWTTAAGGLFTVALERRLPTWRQIKFAAIMILVSTPTLVWAFSGATIHRPAIPTSFIHIMTGHIYALVYPQALIQTLALGLVAALAMIANHKDNLPACRLGIATLCCVAALTIGTAMPYVTDAQLLLLLLPLRFTSVVVLLAAISAGVLVVLRMNERTDQSLGAFLAAGGFLLKSPIVSIFGFSLLLPATSSGYRSLRIMIPIIGVLAVWLWAPITEASPKSALAFILLSAILVAASWRRQGGISEDDGLLMATGGLLGSMAAVPFSALSERRVRIFRYFHIYVAGISDFQ